MKDIVAKKLLERLEALPKMFDPLADHTEPTDVHEKVVFVPVSLAEELVAFLKTRV